MRIIGKAAAFLMIVAISGIVLYYVVSRGG